MILGPLGQLREITKLDDYELIFTMLKELNYEPYLIKLNETFGTEGLSYEELRLHGYRKLTLPECKNALFKALFELCLDYKWKEYQKIQSKC